MNAKRLIVYLILNVIVSASMTAGVMWLWDKAHPVIPAPCLGSEATPAAASLLATGLPSPAAFSPATVTPATHVVQSGETLGGIAQRYNVSIEALMAANNLSDPNVLHVGQTLVIPNSGYAPTPVAPGTPGALPTNAAEPPRPTATRDPNAPLSQLSIREVKSPGTLADEALVIANQGGPVDLAGWTLRDEAGQLYTFPALTLFEGGAVTLHTAAGSDSVTDLYWGLTVPVWASGRQALLSDAGGNLHTRFTVP
jgi:LysM repeat protein